MLKRLRAIAIGTLPWVIGGSAVIGAIVFVASKEQAASEKYEAERAKRCALSFPALEDAEKQDACKHERDSGQNYLPWWYVLLTWPEGITTWAILATGFVIAWQSNETRKAARAAESQAKHMITSERAWMIVSSRFHDGLNTFAKRNKTRFRWEMKNVGKSPARLLEFNAVARRADRWNMPYLEPSPFFRDPQPLNKLLLVPTDSWGVTWEMEEYALSTDEIASLKQWKQLTIVSYGYIKYLDVFEKEHITRFYQQLWFDKKTSTVYFLPKIEAPPSYTDCD